MAQSRVTEYFSTRKKTFDVIQPSKKLRFDVDDAKSNSKAADIVKLQTCLQTSVKRVAKRKRIAVTTTTGNIKSFLESAQNKQSKLCVEKTANGKTISTNDIKSEPQSGSGMTTIDVHGSAEKNSQELLVKEEATQPMTRIENQGKEGNSAYKSISRSHNHETCSDHKLGKSDVEQPRCSTDSDTILLLQDTKTGHTSQRASSMEEQTYEEVKVEKTSVQNVCVPKPSVNLPIMNGVTNDKHASLREKIKLFKAAASKVKVLEKADTKLPLLLEKGKQISLGKKIELLKETRTKVNVPEKAETKKSFTQKDKVSSLVLPLKYKKLLEMFRATDTVLSMLYNRKEVCTFDKLKESVQQLTKRSFCKDHLGQIASVFPDSYSFSLEKVVSSLTLGTTKTNGIQLTITPILASKTGETSDRLTPTVLLERRDKFHSNLVEITKKHHESFLASLHPPICVPSKELMRWHPKFPIEDIPDIPVFSLPEPAEHKVTTAKDVLEKMNGIVCSRIEKALQSVAKEKAPTSTNQAKPAPVKIKSGPLKGLSQALLDKIRNKENARIAREMFRKPESEKRLEMLHSLPEIARIIRTYFVVEKRAAISLEDVKFKVCDSFHSPISPDDVQEHLHLLCPIVPKWITYVTIPRGVFLKLDKNVDLNDIMKAIDVEILKEKS